MEKLHNHNFSQCQHLKCCEGDNSLFIDSGRNAFVWIRASYTEEAQRWEGQADTSNLKARATQTILEQLLSFLKPKGMILYLSLANLI